METITLARVVGWLWGLRRQVVGVSCIIVGSGMLLTALMGLGRQYFVVPRPAFHFATHAARLPPHRVAATASPQFVPAVVPQYFAPLSPPPGYSYPAGATPMTSADAMRAYLERQGEQR